MDDVRFRPIDAWPGRLLDHDERQPTPFTADYSDTLAQLRRELGHLDAERVVIQLALRDADIRLDGLPRANASPDHPGVILSFDSRHGPLRYLTDRYRSRGWSTHATAGWQANLRAIVLGLEALRRVDRYGITQRGEQYKGWAELPSGIAAPAAQMTVDEAARLLLDLAGRVPASAGIDPKAAVRQVIDRAETRAYVYRDAVKACHPDHGGDPATFQRLQAAHDILQEVTRG